MNRSHMMVAAIENGTVIDHIPSSRLFEVIKLLGIDSTISDSVFIGFNLNSEMMGKKSILKIANRFFSQSELDKLDVVAPNVTLCIIRNFEVAEKRPVTLPNELHNLVQCNNPKCISNNEPMPTHFHVVGEHAKCRYCEVEQLLSNVKLVD